MNEPNPAEIQNLLALLNAGDTEKAISSARRLIGKFPQSATLHLLLGAGFYTQGKLDPAITSYKKALALQPNHVDALNNLGIALRKKGNLAEAAVCYEKAAQVQPHNPDILCNLAILLDAQGDSARAIALYQKVIALAPGHFDALNNLASIYHKSERFTEAAESLAAAHAVRPTDIATLRTWGTILEALGKSEMLAEVDAKILALDPDHIVRLGSLACAERALGRASISLLSRITNLPLEKRGDIATAMWAALALNLPEKAFAYKSSKLNTLPYRELGGFYRSASLQERLNALPEMRGEWPTPGQGLVVYAAASGDYAEIYARDLVRSVLSRSPQVGFHLHVMNPGSYDMATLSAAFPDGRLTLTSEDIGPCEKTVYSTRRFLRLAQLIRRAENHYLAVDADSFFNADVGAFHNALGEYDTAIYLRNDQPFISQMISAGILAVAPTIEGRAFIDFIAAYILHFEERNAAKWFVDQLALISAATWFNAHIQGVVIKPLPGNAIDWSETHDPESLLWTQKGGEKEKITGNL